MSMTSTHYSLADLKFALSQLNPTDSAVLQLHALVRDGLATLPLPGSGDTLLRWQALAAVAAHDLSLAKLFEGHTDALAILAELGEPREVGLQLADGMPPSWAMWAAETPGTRVTITQFSGRAARIDGMKCWCSGAQTASHGLLTAWHAGGSGPQLVRVTMNQIGVSVSSAAWAAVGMAGSASVDVNFCQAEAYLVGGRGEYLLRAGFWQGGAGVAACWYGGALGLGLTLKTSLRELPAPARTPFRLAALGKINLALTTTAAVLRDAAQWIDSHPFSNASNSTEAGDGGHGSDVRAVALRARLAAENCATTVLDEAGRALGAAAFCRNAKFARAAADLPVFIRQSHAERDFSALAECVIADGAESWEL